MWPRWFSDFFSKPGGLFLRPLSFSSFFYGKAVLTRLLLYEKGLLEQRKVPGVVISVGNITTGGTGKTPAVIMLARWAMDKGYRVAVLSRGYGGKRKEKLLLVSDTEKILSRAAEAGDEAFLLARRLPGVPVVVSADRRDAALAAIARWGCNFFILDDGFQHIRLKRQVDLVLLDAMMPFGNGRLLPLGPLREPTDQLKRADALILTRWGTDVGEQQFRLLPGEDITSPPIFRAAHIPNKIVLPETGEDLPLDFLAGKRLLGFAGIGRPESFSQTLKTMGADIVDFLAFADHHNYSEKDFSRVISLAKAKSVDLIVTTEKDWVKIEPLARGVEGIGYVSIQFRILGDEEAFFRLIERLIAGQRD